MSSTIFILLVAASIVTFAATEYNNYDNSYSNNRNDQGSIKNLEWSDYRYSIDEGNCDGIKLAEEDIKKNSDPYTSKKTTYTWTGREMFHVTCIRVQNRMPRNENAAEARISDGGVGKGHVRIEMLSKNGQATNFHIEIWGKESTKNNNVAFLTYSSNILYANGKKYCECQ